MAPIKKILVPVDFSGCSKQALEYAATLAERYFDSSVDVLHVWNAPSPDGGERQHARVQAMKDMEEILADFTARGVTSIRRLHEEGDTVPAILEAARRGGYDLIVMGTHGRTGLAHDYLGSVAEKVVRRSTIPVLTVRARSERATATAQVAEASRGRTDPRL